VWVPLRVKAGRGGAYGACPEAKPEAVRENRAEAAQWILDHRVAA